MKKINIKTVIIAAIIALSLIGATVFVCVTVLNGDKGGDNTGEVGGDNNASENPGHIDDGGWTWD